MVFGSAHAVSQGVVIPKPNASEFKSSAISLSGKVFGAPTSALKVLNTSIKKGEGKDIFFKKDESLKPEGYAIQILPSRVEVQYKDPAGAFYAAQTIAQLLQRDGRVLPQGTIKDWPRFQWRGLHLDVSRHFFSVDYIKRQLDFMSTLKMNRFHWHLTDDGGWRMESKAYPKLTSIGAWRVDTGGKWPGGPWNYENLRFIMPGMKEKPYGGYYTQNQIREVVRYAADRHIEVIPEIELPGHQLPVLVAYPELACKGIAPSIPGKSGTNVFCAGKEETFKFLETILDETMALFPSKVIHIGGDEVWKPYWEGCSDCKERMAKEGLKNADELQSYFIKRIDKYVTSKGRKIIGWDEILEGGLADNAMVMSWRGISGGIAAAKAKHEVVMSPTSHSYFDYSYTAIPTELVYNFDPIPKELDDREKKYILGVQGNLWTEHIPTEEHLQRQLWPRGLAMAEIGWTEPGQKVWDDFVRRMDKFLPILQARGFSFMITAPKLETQLVILQNGKPQTVPMPKLENLYLRYTTNGVAPNSNSPIVPDNLIITRPGVYKLAYFDSNGRSGDVTTLSVINPPASTNVKGIGKATREEYDFKGSSVKDIPASGGKTSEVTEISTAGVNRENVALRFKTNIVIPEDGEYTLYLTSDDGSALLIAGSTLIDNDGAHATVTKSTKIKLNKGAYPIEVLYFQLGGGASLKVEIEGPGLERQVLGNQFIGLP